MSHRLDFNEVLRAPLDSVQLDGPPYGGNAVSTGGRATT